MSLMCRGSTLLYRLEVLVCTKSITRIKTKGGAILRLTEAINHQGSSSYLKGDVHLYSISPTSESINLKGCLVTNTHVITSRRKITLRVLNKSSPLKKNPNPLIYKVLGRHFAV